MIMTKIKFCGLTRKKDIEAVNILKPEYIGFVFAKSSKRFIDPVKAFELKKILSPEILSVGIFVDENIKIISEIANNNIIDLIQLHGNESEKYIYELRKLINQDKKIIKAFTIDNKNKNNILNSAESSADYILIDSGAGTGKLFDWEILNLNNISRKYFLAGGLNPENVGHAVKLLNPYAVDVSSGIELDGLKNYESMYKFIEAVRGEKI